MNETFVKHLKTSMNTINVVVISFQFLWTYHILLSSQLNLLMTLLNKSSNLELELGLSLYSPEQSNNIANFKYANSVNMIRMSNRYSDEEVKKHNLVLDLSNFINIRKVYDWSSDRKLKFPYTIGNQLTDLYVKCKYFELISCSLNNLKHLNLKFENNYKFSVKNLPRNIESLDIDGEIDSEITLLKINSKDDWPQNLKVLRLIRVIYSNINSEVDYKLPPRLKKVSLIGKSTLTFFRFLQDKVNHLFVNMQGDSECYCENILKTPISLRDLEIKSWNVVPGIIPIVFECKLERFCLSRSNFPLHEFDLQMLKHSLKDITLQWYKSSLSSLDFTMFTSLTYITLHQCKFDNWDSYHDTFVVNLKLFDLEE
ncbi:hypothetical protein DFJ63DRAFT_314381 [Scheffersomyces coipomensis]|uniref:uncharacterized protein n=1 Tax=Scheffersomyces coipomensis TaxID=1788519 RepID=UPI00315D86C7